MYASGRKRHKSPEGEYRCPKASWGYPEPGCPCSVGWHKLDKMLWEKVMEFLSGDEKVERELQAKIEALRLQEADAESACERLQSQH